MTQDTALRPADPGPTRRPRLLPTWETVVLGSWLLVLVALARLFPRSGDDWAWGAPEGLDRARNLFAGINGRYAGSTLIVLLTRAGPLAPVVVAATVVLTLALLLHLARARTPLGYAVVGALFLLMPLGVWRQGVVWLSGFVNYAFGALFLLLLLVVAQGERERPERRSSPAGVLVLGAGGLVGSLFMEHVTLCACLIGLALVVRQRVTQGGWPLRTAAWVTGSWLGAALMFSNSAYRTAVSGTGSYQSVQPASGAGATQRLLVRLADYLPAHALTHVGPAALVLPVLVLALLVARRSGARLWGASVVVALLVAGLEVQQLLASRRDALDGPVHALPLAIAALTAGLLVLALRSGAVRATDRRWTITWVAVALPVLVGPLLLVSPLGPRCFYPSFLLVLLLVACLVGEVQDALPARATWALAVPGHVLTAGLALALLVVYADISRAADERLATVRSAVASGRQLVVISPLPHSYHLHDADPYWSLLQGRYEEYYALPASLRIRLRPNPWLRVPGQPEPRVAP